MKQLMNLSSTLTKDAYTLVHPNKVMALPRLNYRTDINHKDIKAFAKRLESEGQLQPILVGQFSDEAKTADPTLVDLLGDQNQLLVAGERRLLALSLLGVPVKVHFMQFDSLQAVYRAQMAENMDRQNTNPIDDAKGFERYLKSGGSKLSLLKIIDFPKSIRNKKERMAYINDYLMLLTLSENVQKAVKEGRIFSTRVKNPQALVFLDYPHFIQDKVLDYLSTLKGKKTDEEIRSLCDGHLVPIPALIDQEETDFEGGACATCPNKRMVTVTEWKQGSYNQVEKVHCLNEPCLINKLNVLAQNIEVKMDAEFGKGNWNWYGKSHEISMVETEVEVLRNLSIAKAGSCTHLRAVHPLLTEDYTYAYAPHYVCTDSSCAIHYPEQVAQKKKKQKERTSKKQEKATLKIKETFIKEVCEQLLTHTVAYPTPAPTYYLLYRVINEHRTLTAIQTLIEGWVEKAQVEEDKAYWEFLYSFEEFYILLEQLHAKDQKYCVNLLIQQTFLSLIKQGKTSPKSYDVLVNLAKEGKVPVAKIQAQLEEKHLIPLLDKLRKGEEKKMLASEKQMQRRRFAAVILTHQYGVEHTAEALENAFIGHGWKNIKRGLGVPHNLIKPFTEKSEGVGQVLKTYINELLTPAYEQAEIDKLYISILEENRFQVKEYLMVEQQYCYTIQTMGDILLHFIVRAKEKYGNSEKGAVIATQIQAHYNRRAMDGVQFYHLSPETIRHIKGCLQEENFLVDFNPKTRMLTAQSVAAPTEK